MKLSVGFVLCALTLFVYAENAKQATVQDSRDVASLTRLEIEEQLQQCPILISLSEAKHASHQGSSSSFLSRAFAVLFPSDSPAINSLLGTLYISGPPNFLLALCPPNIDPASLSTMVAFAVGGLLGDTFFHLLPEIFLGEAEGGDGTIRAVIVDGNKNLLLGVGILVGFCTFVAMDKGLRIATGGEGHNHSHSHNDMPQENEPVSASTSGVFQDNDSTLRQRKGGKHAGEIVEIPKKEPQKSIKLSAYLSIIADFTHNITDGLALSSSFYSSPALGATTTLAVFCHEIPHEVGDFALLIQGGMSKKVAMGLQFVTALGAVIGAIIGILVQEYGSLGGVEEIGSSSAGLLSTGLSWGDMLLPFTAGTFLYVGTVGVIPELLETGSDKAKEVKNMIKQFVAIAAGAAIMIGISWE
ncbi:putative ZIP zinc transporter [Polychaeton citri CBS 116435]|uniref:ZIP zinc transporter n=1 Tax=Polychaeton citri CBS 116435 TaxID=1314669 RepID=A0A9P4UQK7_9PEZI|nr:putative ZIP zinc transporter [Polychaeton citri CBS 116435]